MGRGPAALEIPPLSHRSPPLDVGFADDVLEQIVDRQQALTGCRQRIERPLEIVEVEPNTFLQELSLI